MVVAIHVALSLGLALILTPLMSSALGSLPWPLYPHGSAILSTLQQVAAAAGTALFITVMTVGVTSASADGATAVTAQSAGIHLAFFCGVFLALLSAVCSLFVKRPTEPMESAVVTH